MTERTCPTCGASTSSLIANCEYCGIELHRSEQRAISPEEHIGALRKRLEACSMATPTGAFKLNKQVFLRKKMAEVIEMFPIPTDIQLLSNFFVYCHGNSGDPFWQMSDPASLAWRSKASAAYQALRLASLNNPQLAGFLAPFDQVYGIRPKAGGIKGFLSKLFGG